MRVQVMGRNKKWAWLRVFTDRWYILTMPESVLPRGCKEAKWVHAELNGPVLRGEVHYTADITVTGKADDNDEEAGSPPD